MKNGLERDESESKSQEEKQDISKMVEAEKLNLCNKARQWVETPLFSQ